MAVDTYFERFFLEFDSEPDGSGDIFHYRVSLQQRLPSDNPAPTPLRLEGAPSPFVVSLQNNDDPLMVLRTASARISFANDIALSELLATDGFEWRVTLTRVEDAKRLYVGYITAEAYTQPAVESTTIYTVNAESPMAPISAVAMPLDGIGMLSIGELLAMAINTTLIRDIERVYLPAIFSSKDSSEVKDYAEILQWKFSISQYMNDDYTDDGISDKYSSYAEAISAICELFGWSLVDNGDGSIYFISPGYQGSYMEIAVSQLQATFIPAITKPRLIDSKSLFSTDDGNTVSFRQGYGGVIFTAEATEPKVVLPSVDANVMSQSFTRETVTAEVYSGDLNNPARYKAEVANIDTIVRNNPFKLYGYFLDTTLGTPEWKEITPVGKPTTTTTIVGANFRRFDWCDPADLNLDADNPKRGWSFTDALVLNDVAVYYDSDVGKLYNMRLPAELPLIKAESKSCFASRGALVVDFSMMISPFDGFYMVDSNLFEGGSIKDAVEYLSHDHFSVDTTYWLYNQYVIVSIKVGDKYFNGTEWINDHATFSIPVSTDRTQWRPVLSNKTVDMLYEGDKGYYIPIDTPMSGKLEFCVYAGLYPAYTGMSDHIGTIPLRYFKDLTVRFEPVIENRISTDADLTYSRVFSRGYKENVSKSLRLHSSINASEYSSSLYDGAYNAIDVLYRTTSATAAKPEQFLLDEYQRVYGRSMRRWRCGTWYRDLSPVDVYNVASDDVVAMLTGYTADFAESTMEVYLSDMKSVKIVRNVK